MRDRYVVSYVTELENLDVPVKNRADANRIAWVLIAAGFNHVAVCRVTR